MGITSRRLAFDRCGGNLNKLREILHADLNSTNNHEIKLVIIFCILILHNFSRPGSFETGLKSLKKQNIQLEIIIGEKILKIAYLDRRNEYICKIFVVKDDGFYNAFKFFLETDFGSPFFYRIGEHHHLDYLRLILPGLTALQLRRSGASFLFYMFLKKIKEPLENLQKNRPDFFFLNKTRFTRKA